MTGEPAARFVFAPMTEPDARAVAAWRYEGPYALYNADPARLDETLRALLAPRNHYYAVRTTEDGLVGTFCFGPDAQVPGGDYDDLDALDIGLGLRPELTGRGLGEAFLLAGLAFAREQFVPAPTRFRLTVATFNRRAIRVYEHAGFRPTHRFVRPSDGHEFLQMDRPAWLPATKG
ncbi:MAG: hypothetical protein AVDCRST_MAG88-4296 [uncultured Thermomicrobiales bacterium]|uniref:N-acetyltransferase domain-containing protein n=1 Tax=uncultured Thermomicrobiales bacterium TaxID=1645740 RepID=A0A6J4VYI2_9BACT|nr:MAG: hypothetical protein AVDCRST_MAG88-4296 [uncultured Thermomicrobiales bacterium]